MPGSSANLLLALNSQRSVPQCSPETGGRDIAWLTAKIRAGDEEAFREFHRVYFDRLYHFLLVVARGREDEAMEALQETLLRVVHYIRKFENEETFWSWLKAVARSAARDGGRKHSRYLALLQRFTLHLERSAENSPDEMDAILQETLEELDSSDRQIIKGKYMHGATVRELALETGLTEKAVESRLLRLRRQIRETILKKLAP